MTTDDRIVEYLRSRGQAQPPDGFVSSVMSALDDPLPSQPLFAGWMPAIAIAAGTAVIAAVALLVGQGPSVGPGPSPASESPTPSTSVEPTIDDLGVALLDAVDVLRAAPGVEGRQQVEIDGTIGSATWFDWRPNGDQVIVQRQDLDVTETGWWLVPDGAPPTTGQRIYTNIQAKVGDRFFFTDEAGEWQVAARDDGFPTGGFGPAILDGSILPWRPLDGLVSSLHDPSEARIERDALPDGGVEWRLEFEWLGAPLIQRWTIGPGGELRAWTFEREDRPVDPEGDFHAHATRGWLQYTINDGDPIESPDTATDPDEVELGLPADFPLGAGTGVIDYRAYVEDAIDVLEAYHWDSANIDWTVVRSAALDDLADDVTADQAHARIQRAIATFDPFNTAIVRPADVPPDGSGGDGSGSAQLPAGDRRGGIGVIVLPSPMSGGPDALADYLEAARTEMAAAESETPACGWVLDLRDYATGGWGPPIWALGGVIGEGRAVSFSSEAGEWGIDIGADGTATVRGIDAPPAVESPYVDLSFVADSDEALIAAVEQEPPYVPATSGPPVAVLVGPETASGGEQAVVAFLGRPDTRLFGGPTAGQPIVTPNLPMADGARLRVPIWVPVDREGTRYTSNISPDDVIGDTRPLGSDAVLDAAVDWLEAQPGCP